jgi:hypothetical protein
LIVHGQPHSNPNEDWNQANDVSRFDFALRHSPLVYSPRSMNSFAFDLLSRPAAFPPEAEI